jgi:hypothetical protein
VRKPEWLFVGVLLLVGIYFSYRYFSKTEKFDPLQLVPGTAAAIYETSDPFQLAKELSSRDYWQDLNKISQIKEASSFLHLLDSLIADKKRINNLLSAYPAIVSLHVTGNESSGLMFYVPAGAGAGKTLENWVGAIDHEIPKRIKREYAQHTIHEISTKNTRLTYLNYKNYLIVSKYGYLVEDVVRNINSDFESNLITNHQDLIAVPKLGNDGGNIYLNGAELTALLNTTLPPLNPASKKIAKSIFFDLNLSSDNLFLSGFIFNNTSPDLVSIFKNQEAGLPNALKLVSDNAASVMSIKVSDFGSWHSRWMKEFTTKNSSEKVELVEYLRDELVLSTFYSSDAERQDKQVMIGLADPEGALNILNKRAEEIALSKQDTVFYETYSDYSIGLVEEDEYVASLFGKPFAGFKATYYVIYHDYLVLATSSERIKTWLRDIDNDLIWGRSIDKNELINESLSETNFSLIYSNPWVWSLIRDEFNTKAKNWWVENELPIKQFSSMTVQLANLDNRFYTELKIQYTPQELEPGQQNFNEESLTQLTSKLANKPKLVKNHNNGFWEVLMQDSSYQLSLLDDHGDLLWQKSLDKPIISDVIQLDYYKNRKLQYLFATDSALNILDRNGVALDNWPKKFDTFSIKDLFVIDYDYSRNYRILVSDNSGNLRMFNTEGELLKGWDPLVYNSKISDQVFHVRVRGKDRIIVGLSNGTIDVRNRRGEEQSGFPLDLEFNLVNPLHFNVGSTFADSRFTALSDEGLLVEFDLDGKEYARTQLYQPSGTARFALAIDKARNDIIIARQDLNRLSILEKDGTTLFEKDFLDNHPKDIQYYNLGVDKRLYIVRDTVTGKIYLYNKSGTLINTGNVFSDYPLSVVYRNKESKCYIYTAINQTVEVKSFSF